MKHQLMPLALVLARQIIMRLTNLTRNETLKMARPDAKSQVTLEYDEKWKILGIDTIVLSVQHCEEVTNDFQIEKDLKELVIKPVLDSMDMIYQKLKISILIQQVDLL